MARSASETSGIQQIFECPICVELMNNPKTLQCEHSFCKECLEGCVTFQINGAPSILCPTCRAEHILGYGETVSDMKAQLILKQILDEMPESRGRQVIFILIYYS